MYQVLVQASMNVEMLAHSACWHGSPLQGVVKVCDGTRGKVIPKSMSVPLTVPMEVSV